MLRQKIIHIYKYFSHATFYKKIMLKKYIYILRTFMLAPI